MWRVCREHGVGVPAGCFVDFVSECRLDITLNLECRWVFLSTQNDLRHVALARTAPGETTKVPLVYSGAAGMP